MKKTLLGCLWVFGCIFIFSSASTESAYAAKTARVEVLYMNHGPLMETLDRMKDVFSGYGDKIRVSWYDFESREGEVFKAEKGINQHVPLVIWIDGNTVVTIGPKRGKIRWFSNRCGSRVLSGKVDHGRPENGP